MKYILFILLFISISATAQVHDYNLKIDPPKDPDSAYCLVTATTGSNFAGRGQFVSMPQLAALLEEFLTVGGGISDGDKGDITVTFFGEVWDIDANAVGQNEIAANGVGASEIAANAVGSSELAATSVTPTSYTNTNLTVDADGRITSASNGTDNNSIDDRSFYVKGTTTLPSTSTDSIETTNVKYVLFKGLSGGLPTKIEMLKEGVLVFDKQQHSVNSLEYFMRFKPQDITSVADFSFCSANNHHEDVTGNWESFLMGWNVNPSGGPEIEGESMLGFNFELGWSPDNVNKYIDEFHIIHADTSGRVRRWFSSYMPNMSSPDWVTSLMMSEFSVSPPDTTAPFWRLDKPTNTTQRMRFVNPYSGQQFQFVANQPGRKLELYADGVVDAKLKFAAFDTIVMVDTKVGINTEIPYAHLTTFGNVGTYSTYGTSAGTPIGPSIYLGDAAFYSSGFYNKTPGISAVYNAIQGVSSDLAFYAYNGARTERMRLTENGNFGVGTNNPQQTLHVAGTMRLTGSDGTATAPMGRDADGDVSAMTAGAGISYTGGAIVNTGDTDASNDITVSDTAAMLSHFVERGDTSTMLNNYITRTELHDEMSRYYYFNDFTTHVNADVVGRDMYASITGTGATFGMNASSRKNAVGVVYFQSGTTSTGRCALIANSTTVSAFGGGAWVYETKIDTIPTLSTSGERYIFWTGFGDVNSSALQSDGAYFVYDEGGVTTGSTASANWQCVTAAGGSRTWHTTSTAVGLSQQKLKIEVNAAGTAVLFYINGSLIHTATGTIPTTAITNATGFANGILKAVGNLNRTVGVDYIKIQCDYTTPK